MNLRRSLILTLLAFSCAHVLAQGSITLTYVDDESPGTLRWMFKTRGSISTSPALSPDESRLYVVSGLGRLSALDTATGDPETPPDEVWGLNIPGGVYSSPL